MISYVSSWAGSVVTAVVAVSVLEMILPDVSSKKYIKTIIGVYILYTIISPVIKFINGGDIKIDYSDYEKYFNTALTADEFDLPSLEETYQSEIERQIEYELENIGYSTEVSAEIDIEKGICEKVDVIAEKSIGKEVSKIEIGNSRAQEELSDVQIQEIKQKISELCGIEIKDISVNSK